MMESTAAEDDDTALNLRGRQPSQLPWKIRFATVFHHQPPPNPPSAHPPFFGALDSDMGV